MRFEHMVVHFLIVMVAVIVGMFAYDHRIKPAGAARPASLIAAELSDWLEAGLIVPGCSTR